MTSIYDIPYEDIEIFLVANKEKIPINENDAYDIAFSLLKKRNSVGHTKNIVEWMIAYNLIRNKVNIPTYTIYEINKMDNKEIAMLANLLTMKSNNIESIKNILRYLGKLVMLPEHIDIDPYIIQKVAEVKILSSSLEEVIELFKDNKSLRKVIYDNMKKMIYNYMFGADAERLIKKDREEIIDMYLFRTMNYRNKMDNLPLFIFKLLKEKEIILAKEALKIGSAFDYFFDGIPPLITYLTEKVLESKDTILIINYFEMMSFINTIYYSKIMTEEYIMKNIKFDLNKKDNIPFIYESAIMTKKYKIVKYLESLIADGKYNKY